MKRIMGVYDVDPFYAERFAEAANQKGQVPFTVMAFGSLARLKEFSEKQPLEVLLVADEVEPSWLEGIRTGQTIRLSESREVAEAAETVYKYQPTDGVLREVMARYRAEPPGTPLAAVGVRSRIIGVCSPVGRCGKTGFCLTLGQLLAREGKALYLSLEEHAGLDRLTGTAYKNSLSDLIYQYRQGEYSRTRLGALIHNWGGLDYVAPVLYAEDLAELQGEEMAGLVARIAADGAYDAIVIDLGHMSRRMEPLLEICDRIYAPVKEDCVSAAKVEAWQEYWEVSGRGHLWERVQLLRLPMPGAVLQRETYLEQLLWGEMGDFARKLLKGTGGGGV